MLVIGKDDVALDAAQRLAKRMDVTLLLVGDAELMPPRIVEMPIFRGKPLNARGHLGAFEVEIANYRCGGPGLARISSCSRAGVSADRSRIAT